MINRDLEWFQHKLRTANAEREAFENAWKRVSANLAEAQRPRTNYWKLVSLILLCLCLSIGYFSYLLMETPSKTKGAYSTPILPAKKPVHKTDYFAKKYDACQERQVQYTKRMHEAKVLIEEGNPMEAIEKLEGKK